MLTFLFWNIHKNPIAEIIKNLVDQHQVDVLMLAECTITPGKLLNLFNTEIQKAEFHYSSYKNIIVFTRFSRKFLKPIYESARFSIGKLRLPAREEVLLSVVHLPSKLHWSNEGQGFELTELSKTIRKLEEESGHTRTVLVGDFNMNPFEAGFVAASGLNAINSRKVAHRGFRSVQAANIYFSIIRCGENLVICLNTHRAITTMIAPSN